MRGIAACTALAALVVSPAGFARAEPPPGPSCLALDGCFLDREGRARDAGDAFDALNERRPRPAWAVTQIGLIMLGATVWYLIDDERGDLTDFDFPDMLERLSLQAWTFDNNRFITNFAGHPFNGTVFHLIGRSHDLDILSATGLGFLTSLTWEKFLEWRENPSVNDLIVTTGAGVPIGEFFHWTGRYLNSAPGPGRWWHPVARYTVGLPRTIHLALDGRTEELPGPPDDIGLSSDIWRRFRASYGVVAGATAADSDVILLQELRFAGRLAGIPGYLAPGRFDQVFADGNVSALEVRWAAGADGKGVDFLADSILAGIHIQAIPRPGHGPGRGATLGFGMAYRYRFQDFGSWRDRLGIVHLPGPAIDAHAVGESFRLRLSARAGGDFAGIHSHPYPRWRDQQDPDVVDKAILRRRGYYYGWGVSGRFDAELELPGGALGVRIGRGSYRSQEGLDNDQDLVTVDVEAADRVADYEIWAEVAPGGGRFYLNLRASRQDRRGRAGDVRGTARLETIVIGAGARL